MDSKKLSSTVPWIIIFWRHLISIRKKVCLSHPPRQNPDDGPEYTGSEWLVSTKSEKNPCKLVNSQNEENLFTTWKSVKHLSQSP